MAKYFVESGRHVDCVIQAKNCALEPHKIFWDHFSKSLVTIQVFTSETWAPTRLKNGGKLKLPYFLGQGGQTAGHAQCEPGQLPAILFSKWRTTNQNQTRHCGGCNAAALALTILQLR